jgi:predicted component of type VI protein secretion system
MKVEKKHCTIKNVDGKYLLVNNGAPPEFTRVNDVPVAVQRELADGDRIQLGSVILKFQLRAAIVRAKAKKLALPTPSGT